MHIDSRGGDSIVGRVGGVFFLGRGSVVPLFIHSWQALMGWMLVEGTAMDLWMLRLRMLLDGSA